MVIELSGVQYGLKSYAWFQNRASSIWNHKNRKYCDLGINHTAESQSDCRDHQWFQAASFCKYLKLLQSM